MTNLESPKWFQDALEQKPESQSIEVDGANISYLTWGKKENPGILFVHGGMAHAHWWSFIAPFFAKTHRVIAMNLSGMGDSDWRENYASELWGKEIV